MPYSALERDSGGTRRRVIVVGCAASMLLTFLLRRYRSKKAGEGKGGIKSTSEKMFVRYVRVRRSKRRKGTEERERSHATRLKYVGYLKHELLLL